MYAASQSWEIPLSVLKSHQQLKRYAAPGFSVHAYTSLLIGCLLGFATAKPSPPVEVDNKTEERQATPLKKESLIRRDPLARHRKYLFTDFPPTRWQW